MPGIPGIPGIPYQLAHHRRHQTGPGDVAHIHTFEFLHLSELFESGSFISRLPPPAEPIAPMIWRMPLNRPITLQFFRLTPRPLGDPLSTTSFGLDQFRLFAFAFGH